MNTNAIETASRSSSAIPLEGSRLTSGVFELGGDAPMSALYVHDSDKDVFFVGHDTVRENFAKMGCRAITRHPTDLQQVALDAAPVIGSRPRLRHEPVSLGHLRSIRGQYTGVNPDDIARGMHAVAPQSETWTCGINSAARFAAMMHQKIGDYRRFVDTGPSYGAGFFPRIGGNPEKIQDHLRNQPELHGTDVHQVCNVRFQPIWDGLLYGFHHGGRPGLVLTMDSDMSMHWVCVVGRHEVTHDWYYLNTDGGLYKIPGGDDEFKHWLNMENCWAQRFNFVERFNAVVSCHDCHRKDV